MSRRRPQPYIVNGRRPHSVSQAFFWQFFQNSSAPKLNFFSKLKRNFAETQANFPKTQFFGNFVVDVLIHLHVAVFRFSNFLPWQPDFLAKLKEFQKLNKIFAKTQGFFSSKLKEFVKTQFFGKSETLLGRKNVQKKACSKVRKNELTLK